MEILATKDCEGVVATIGFVMNTAIGCCFYFSSIGGLPVQTVAIPGYLEPLSALFFSAAFLGEALNLHLR